MWSDFAWAADSLFAPDFDRIVATDYFHIIELFHIVDAFEHLSSNRKHNFLLYFTLLGCILSLFHSMPLRLRFYAYDLPN